MRATVNLFITNVSYRDTSLCTLYITVLCIPYAI